MILHGEAQFMIKIYSNDTGDTQVIMRIIKTVIKWFIIYLKNSWFLIG
jgi:hypothetical protein